MSHTLPVYDSEKQLLCAFERTPAFIVALGRPQRFGSGLARAE